MLTLISQLESVLKNNMNKGHNVPDIVHGLTKPLDQLVAPPSPNAAVEPTGRERLMPIGSQSHGARFFDLHLILHKQVLMKR